MTNQPTARIEIRLDGESIRIIHDDPGERLLSALDTAADSQDPDPRLRWLLRSLALRMNDWDLLETARRKLKSGGLINALSVTLSEACRDDRMKSLEPKCTQLITQLMTLNLEIRVAMNAEPCDTPMIPTGETEKAPPDAQPATA